MGLNEKRGITHRKWLNQVESVIASPHPSYFDSEVCWRVITGKMLPPIHATLFCLEVYETTCAGWYVLSRQYEIIHLHSDRKVIEFIPESDIIFRKFFSELYTDIDRLSSITISY